MNHQMKKIFSLLLALMVLSMALLTGCGSSADSETNAPFIQPNHNAEQTSTGNGTAETSSPSELSVRFGYDGAAFSLHLEDNQTARDIAHHVGTADWNLPIYHYDDYEGWESMQYYDIPSRYEITSAPEAITSEKAGEVYYSEPNRIVLFYHDAEISGEYTLVGKFDATDEFIQAVENNPVLEGWGNKIVSISPA